MHLKPYSAPPHSTASRHIVTSGIGTGTRLVTAGLVGRPWTVPCEGPAIHGRAGTMGRQKRKWSHPDTCQFQTIETARAADPMDARGVEPKEELALDPTLPQARPNDTVRARPG